MLNGWVTNQNGPFRYRYLPQQFLSGIDPRAQTEDMGDDPVRASGYALANLKRAGAAPRGVDDAPGRGLRRPRRDLRRAFGHVGHCTWGTWPR